MFKSEGAQKTELVVAAAMAPEVSDAVIAEVAQTIRDMHRQRPELAHQCLAHRR